MIGANGGVPVDRPTLDYICRGSCSASWCFFREMMKKDPCLQGEAALLPQHSPQNREGCPVKSFLLANMSRSGSGERYTKRNVVQNYMISILKLNLGVQEGRDVGWSGATYVWAERKYAQAFGELWNNDITDIDGFYNQVSERATELSRIDSPMIGVPA